MFKALKGLGKCLGFRAATGILVIVILAPIPGLGWMLGTHVLLKYVVQDVLYPVGGGPLDGGERYNIEIEYKGQTYRYERLVRQEKDHLEACLIAAEHGKPQMLDKWVSEFVRP